MSAIVKFENVEKQYGEGESQVTALKDISFDVGEGEFVSIVGPSGCGKTTLLYLTNGILSPSTGSIRVRGVDITSKEHEKFQVGLVFQQPVLLEWRTVLENILLPIEILKENGVLEEEMSFYRARAQELIGLVGLEGFADAKPSELSGGMQQRVSICRSLVYDPPLLLMDEPFGALDAFTRDSMNVELLRIWNETDKTILFVTHNLEEALFLSDRIIVLSQRPGRVKEIVDVDIPRPRDNSIRTTATFNEPLRALQEHFKELE